MWHSNVIYDKDNDGLLSNAEINQFQSDAFSVPLVERDLAGWKKVVSKNNPTTDAVIRDGKFTVSGFLAIFDVFITQNRLEVPWKILRYFKSASFGTVARHGRRLWKRI